MDWVGLVVAYVNYVVSQRIIICHESHFEVFHQAVSTVKGLLYYTRYSNMLLGVLLLPVKHA